MLSVGYVFNSIAQLTLEPYQQQHAMQAHFFVKNVVKVSNFDQLHQNEDGKIARSKIIILNQIRNH